MEFISAPYIYTREGRYNLTEKVIDIFGNDTMLLLPVNMG
jgi:site-specific DNA-methyltransferase (adenine-specific)/adenine-specific DNA-methyltransferase